MRENETTRTTGSNRSTSMADRMEIWGLERLLPSARNARTHSTQQIGEVAASIASFGFMAPVLADAQGVIIAGHARTLAAQQLGLKRVPVIVVDHLSQAEKRAYTIADNQIAQHADWNEERLRKELVALQEEGIDLAVLGFDDAELHGLLGQLQLDSADEELIPDTPAKAVTRPGDVWHMDRHRLLCGDAADPGSFARLLDGQPADMVFTDPPYNVAYRAPGSGAAIANDDLGEDFGAFLETVCAHMLQHTRGALYVCMSSSELPRLYRAFTAAGGHWSTFLIWGKSGFTLGRSDY